MTLPVKKIDLPFNLRAFPASPEEKDAFFTAAQNNDIPALKATLKKWPDAAKQWYQRVKQSNEFQPVILYALETLTPETLAFLLAHGADINQPDNTGDNFPLYATAQQGKAGQLETLLSYGADANQQGKKTLQTPLLIAAYKHHAECVDLLVLCGADPLIRNEHNAHTLDVADNQMTRVITAAQERLRAHLGTPVPSPADEGDGTRTTAEIVLPEKLVPKHNTRSRKNTLVTVSQA